MKFQDRAEMITKALETKSTISVAELSDLLQVSVVTVRKDLQRLEDAGKLKRTFGGAAFQNSTSEEQRRLLAAQRIAERVAQDVEDGDCIIMNAGNTTLLTARNLLSKKQLKVITNSISIARELSKHKEFQLIFLGGAMNANAVFTYGREAIEQLDQYKANKLILSVNGISCSKGLTTRHMEAADLFRKMIERAEKMIVVADDAKFGFESFYYVCGLNDVDQIVTNASKKSEAELMQMEQMGIEICCC